MRIEDTDLERSKKEFSDAICADLKWVGLEWDEGPEAVSYTHLRAHETS